jgi:hypothetical protein
LFAQYAMPELQTQSALLDYPLYRFDGIDQLRHLDTILSIDGLKMIQWTCVAGQPPPTHFLPQLKRNQAAGKGLLIKIEPPWLVPSMEELSSKGLYLGVQASSPAEAADVLKIATQLTHD